MRDHKPTWGPIGEMDIDWKGQIAALERDGYRGSISLETHWRGTDGDRLQASIVCGKNLHKLCCRELAERTESSKVPPTKHGGTENGGRSVFGQERF